MGLFGYNADADIASARAHVNGWRNAHFDERGRIRFTDEELAEHARRHAAYIAAMTRCVQLDFAAHILSCVAAIGALFAAVRAVAACVGLGIVCARLIWSGKAGTGVNRMPRPFPALFMGVQIVAGNAASMARFGLHFLFGIYGITLALILAL